MIKAALFAAGLVVPLAAYGQPQYELVVGFETPSETVAEARVIQAGDGSLYGTRSNEVFKIDATGTLTILHRFRGPDGSDPNPLIQASDGNFYGTASSGGATGEDGGYGTVFKMDPGGAVTTLHRFTGPDGAVPVAPLLQASDGSFYGTTSAGGASFVDDATRGNGTVFKISATGDFTTLHSFTGICFGDCPLTGLNPRTALIQASDGSYYGTTRASSGSFGGATVFRMDAAGTVTTLYRFPRSFPSGAVTEASDGSFYGTALSTDSGMNGAVFKVDGTGTPSTLHTFSTSEGAYPSGGLVQGPDGSLYGTTTVIPTIPTSKGTVFRIDLTGTVTTLHAFAGIDGAFPTGGLFLASDGRFYGTTSRGGPDFSDSQGGYGTVFAIEAAGALTTVHPFQIIASGGASPRSGVIQASDGAFYGTTGSGGFGRGTIFKVSAGTMTTMYRFPFDDASGNGASPVGGVIEARDGRFYGTTELFGTHGYGTAYVIDAAGAVTTLHHFTALEGIPIAGLIQASDGNFYGTTPTTIFRMSTRGAVTILHTFETGTNVSASPQALLEAPNGYFYGTTASDGPLGYGTVFAMDPDGGVTTLYTFTGPDGAYPFAGLIQGNDGSFYGTTFSGGTTFRDRVEAGDGTVFRIDTTGAFTSVHSFTGGDGKSPSGRLTQASDGTIYGVTGQGGLTFGTLFALDAAGTLTTLHQFEPSDGAYPSGVIQADDGALYGTAISEGPGGGGVVFRLTLDTQPGTPWAVPGNIEAEDYDLGGPGVGYLDTTPGNLGGEYRADDVDIKPSSGGGYAIGWFAAGEWLAYTVDVESDGVYAISARVGSALAGRTFHIEVDGQDVTGPIGVPRFGNWDQYATVSRAGVRLHAGVQLLRVVMGPLDYMDFQGLAVVTQSPAHAIPGHIEAEDYDLGGQGVGYFDSTPGNEGGTYRTDDVDIKPSAEGGYAVGWFAAGEWLAYTVDVESDGVHAIFARVGSAFPGRTFHVEIDGRNVTGPIAVPRRANWDRFGTATVARVRLRAGVQILRIVMGPRGYMDFQGFAVVRTRAVSGAEAPEETSR